MGAPVRFQKAVPRFKENAAVERREARRSALWAGSSLPLEGQVRSQDGPTGAAFRAREFRRSASLFIGSAKGSKPTIWHDSPPGCAARQRSPTVQQCTEETTMPRLKKRDCFAEPVIGPAKGRTRWLAMPADVAVERQMLALRGAGSVT